MPCSRRWQTSKKHEKTLRDRQVKKKYKIDERQVLDERVRIVEDGSRRQRSKFPEKRNEPERQGQGQWWQGFSSRFPRLSGLLVRCLLRGFGVSRFLSPRSFSHPMSSFQSTNWDGRRSRHSHRTENFNANTPYRHGNNRNNQMCRCGQGEDACTFLAQLICCWSWTKFARRSFWNSQNCGRWWWATEIAVCWNTKGARKARTKGKDKWKKKVKRSTLRSCTVFTKTTTDTCLKIGLNTWCCNRKNQIPSGTWGDIKHAGRGKKSGQEKGKTQPQTSKGKIKGKSSGKGQACEKTTKPSQETGKDKGNSKKGFTGGESSEDWKIARWDSPSHTSAWDTYVVSRLELECPVCTDVTDGIALKKQLILATHVEVGVQAEFTSSSLCTWPFVWLVRTHNAKHRFRARELPDLSHLTQVNRDTENKLRWRVKLGQNESERLGFANMMNKRIVPCNTSQGPEMGQVIRFFPSSENVVYRSDRENESPKTEAPRKTVLPKRTWTHRVGTQTDERPWTDSDLRVTKTQALHWWNWAMYLPFMKKFWRERYTTKSLCTTSICWAWSPYGSQRNPWASMKGSRSSRKNSSSTARGSEWKE